MKENKLKGVLYDENHTLMEWQEPLHADPPGMIEAIKHLKESINDYLTRLVNEEKVCNIKEEAEYFDDDDEEEEEEFKKDKIPGLIKEMEAVSGNCIGNTKRKINYANQVKKIKK